MEVLPTPPLPPTKSTGVSLLESIWVAISDSRGFSERNVVDDWNWECAGFSGGVNIDLVTAKRGFDAQNAEVSGARAAAISRTNIVCIMVAGVWLFLS